MSEVKPTGGSTTPAHVTTIILQLYVADGATNSLEAIANLKSICDEYTLNNYEIEIIDILQDPLRAMHAGVFMTPMLINTLPAPAQMLGNLSDREK
jgi:circadian clock protein KaiB